MNHALSIKSDYGGKESRNGASCLYVLTFTAEPDSSKLERNAWVRKGFSFSGSAESTAQASHSAGGMSMIEETTEIDTSCGFMST
jgi:hypothetical protein